MFIPILGVLCFALTDKPHEGDALTVRDCNKGIDVLARGPF